MAGGLRGREGGGSVKRLVFFGALVLALAGCGWTNFGYDSGATRFNMSENKVGLGNIGKLSMLNGFVRSSPTIWDGTLYDAGNDGTVYAFR